MAEENGARAAQLQEQTRARVQRHAQEKRARILAEEEAARHRAELEAMSEQERQREVAMSQQRAQARAAETRLRARMIEEERQCLQEEESAMEQQRVEAALRERQLKRQVKPGAAPPVVQSLAAAGPEALSSLVDANRQMKPSEVLVTRRSPAGAQAEPPSSTVAQLAAPPLVDSKPAEGPGAHIAAKAAKGSKIPPRPHGERVKPRAEGVVAANSVASKASVKPTDRRPHMSKDVTSDVVVQQEFTEIPGRSHPQVDNSGDGPVHITVGFFGIGGDPLGDADEYAGEGENPEWFVQPDDPAAFATRVAVVAPPASSQPGAYRSQSQDPGLVSRQMSTHDVVVKNRAYSQPPFSRQSSVPGSRASTPGAGRFPLGPCSPGGGSTSSDPAPRQAGGRGPAPLPQPAARVAKPWKQKAVNVPSTDHYLALLKAARGGGQHDVAGNGQIGQSPSKAGVADVAVDGPVGYGDLMRQRAGDVEVAQRREEGERLERGYAAVQRVQQRAQRAQSRSTSTDSMRGQPVL